MLVIRVLIVAPPTSLKVGTSWSDAARGGSENFIQAGTRKPRFLFPQACFYAFAGQNERNEDGLAGAAFVSRKSCEPFATVDELFDVKSQVSILQGQCRRERLARAALSVALLHEGARAPTYKTNSIGAARIFPAIAYANTVSAVDQSAPPASFAGRDSTRDPLQPALRQSRRQA